MCGIPSFLSSRTNYHVHVSIQRNNLSKSDICHFCFASLNWETQRGACAKLHRLLSSRIYISDTRRPKEWQRERKSTKKSEGVTKKETERETRHVQTLLLLPVSKPSERTWATRGNLSTACALFHVLVIIIIIITRWSSTLNLKYCAKTNYK